MHNHFMRAALSLAESAAALGEVPVGAVVVKDNKIIASAHNECEADNNSLRHAEIIAIERAMQKLGDSRLSGCDLYVTLEPCAMCCGAISHARLRRVYFGAYDKLAGCIESNLRCFDKSSPLSDVEFYCGIMESECSELLKEFFKNLR